MVGEARLGTNEAPPAAVHEYPPRGRSFAVGRRCCRRRRRVGHVLQRPLHFAEGLQHSLFLSVAVVADGLENLGDDGNEQLFDFPSPLAH